MPGSTVTLDAQSVTRELREFYLSAQVENDTLDAIPPFESLATRVQHDRLDMHFGVVDASLIQLSEAIGPVPQGSSITDALSHIMAAVLDLEAGVRTLSIDAEIGHLRTLTVDAEVA